MERFAALVDALVYTRSRNGKLELIADYLRTTPDPDRGWALAALTDCLSFPAVKASTIRNLMFERVDPVLWTLSRDFVGDTAETASLLWPDPPREAESPPSLGETIALLRRMTRVSVMTDLPRLFDRLDSTGRYALIKAGWASAGVWVLSMGGRFCFAVWASHGGGPSLYRFSVAHDLSIDVWTAAIVLMALGEVLARTGLMVLRTRRALAAQNAPAGQELLTV